MEIRAEGDRGVTGGWGEGGRELPLRCRESLLSMLILFIIVKNSHFGVYPDGKGGFSI